MVGCPTTQEKYQLVHNLVKKGGSLTVKELCEDIVCVSRSGYYNWLKTAEKREEREKKDRADFELIKEVFDYKGYDKGRRTIGAMLRKKGTPMNHKKISRLMRKYGLECRSRRPNPYRKMAKALKTNQIAPNLVNRQFKKFGPRECLLTDITYLPYRNGTCYLSTLLDVCTHEVLGYKYSTNLRVEFVLDSVDIMMEKHGTEMKLDAIVHSDQGCHYTSYAFQDKLRDTGFRQSMSRKGNCWDNAPQESFFGHMKDDIRRQLGACNTAEDVFKVVDQWMFYYNQERPQCGLNNHTPSEYYEICKEDNHPDSSVA